jgi:TolB-like protein/Flp pilus assembly protein TadD
MEGPQAASDGRRCVPLNVVRYDGAYNRMASDSPSTQHSTNNPGDRLDSWKEIASYLKRDVRTVQRWERREGLPVHRHQHEKLGSVYAFSGELARWFESRRNSLPAHQPEKIKLAILPFREPNNSDPYFSDGLTDEMITEATRLQSAGLSVLARHTAAEYDETAASLAQLREKLGVDYVLHGRIRRAGNRVRIAAQLSEIQDHTQLWANTYERELQDVLGVQAEIAQAIASEIGLALNLKQSNRLRDLQQGKARVEPAAYDAYLKGRYHLHQMSPAAIENSVQEFERAVQLDPVHAPSHAALASANALLAIAPFDLKPPRDVMPRAEAAARKAMELDPSLAEAHTALALVQHHYHWNWSQAEASYRRSLELNPSHAGTHLWYSWLLLALRRQSEALAEIDRTMQIVQETDPHRLVGVHATRAQAYYFGREFERALTEGEKGLALDAGHFMLRYILGRCCIRLGQMQKAIVHFKTASSAPGEVPLVDAALGLAYAVIGDMEQAKRISEALRKTLATRYVPPTYFAMLYAGLGDRTRALMWLEKALAERADGLTWLAVEPMLDDMRDDPRFQELVRKVGLPT